MSSVERYGPILIIAAVFLCTIMSTDTYYPVSSMDSAPWDLPSALPPTLDDLSGIPANTQHLTPLSLAGVTGERYHSPRRDHCPHVTTHLRHHQITQTD